jgi:putative colanic acid biosynthesis UDP-glucose lipid carrier transferase
LIGLAPVLLLLALGVKLTSRGPVLYRQERMGLDGQRFRMLKLRTMRVDAEAERGPSGRPKTTRAGSRTAPCSAG